MKECLHESYDTENLAGLRRGGQKGPHPVGSGRRSKRIKKRKSKRGSRR